MSEHEIPDYEEEERGCCGVSTISQKHLDWIIHKHKLWLEKSPDGEKADLSNMEMCNANLRNANLRNANLRNAKLCSAKLCNADIRDANLYNAKLCNADMRGADLRGAGMHGADLTGADLLSAKLCNTNMRFAELSYAELSFANLREADLSNAYMRGAKLWGADLRNAKLRNVNLYNADMRDADMRGADLCGTDLHGANVDLHKSLGLPPPDPDLPRRVAEQALKPDALDMDRWHTCETTHCLAGWAIHLTGPAGYALEEMTSPWIAGAILMPSAKHLFSATNEEAIKWLKAQLKGGAA